MFSIRHYTLASLAGIVLMVTVPGCEPERPDIVPSSAEIGAAGNGRLRFVAANDGTAYVYDWSQRRLVWSGTAVRGESVEVDPQSNRVIVGGTVRSEKSLIPNDRVSIYFDASPLPPPSNGVLVTPNVTVQPGQTSPGGVTVQPGVTVTPAPR